MSSIASLVSLSLPFPPSCVAFSQEHPSYFIVGTYFLEKNEEKDGVDGGEGQHDAGATPQAQSRLGSLMLYRLDSDRDQIDHVETLPVESAILDIEFCHDHPSVLAVATSTGIIHLYRLQSPHQASRPENTAISTVPRLSLIQAITVAGPTSLVLDLVWHGTELSYTLSSPSEARVISIPSTILTQSDTSYSDPTSRRTSTNSVGHTDLSTSTNDSDSDIRHVLTVEASSHSLEPWTLSRGLPSNSPGTSRNNVLWTGADDSSTRFFSWSTLSTSQLQPDDDGGEATITRQIVDRKSHGAGVTAILPLPGLDGTVVLTGSYDDRIRILRLDELRGRFLTLGESDLGGGVWRLHLVHHGSSKEGRTRWVVLASCMHAGARLVAVTRSEVGDGEEKWEIDVLAKFEEHESMNYGSDVQPLTEGTGADDGVRRFLSTSFYDRKLCYWKYDFREGTSKS